jgi:prepilin-type processing-associated H-X9-DG protein
MGAPVPPGIDPSMPISVQPLLWYLETEVTPNPELDLSNIDAITAITDADLDLDYSPYGGPSSKTLFRLREGIERFFISDINNPAATAIGQSELAIMWDTIAIVAFNFNHIPGGSNVLYMDGHVKFVRYPDEKMPVNVLFALVGLASSA